MRASIAAASNASIHCIAAGGFHPGFGATPTAAGRRSIPQSCPSAAAGIARPGTTRPPAGRTTPARQDHDRRDSRHEKGRLKNQPAAQIAATTTSAQAPPQTQSMPFRQVVKARHRRLPLRETRQANRVTTTRHQPLQASANAAPTVRSAARKRKGKRRPLPRPPARRQYSVSETGFLLQQPQRKHAAPRPPPPA